MHIFLEKTKADTYIGAVSTVFLSGLLQRPVDVYVRTVSYMERMSLAVTRVMNSDIDHGQRSGCEM